MANRLERAKVYLFFSPSLPFRFAAAEVETNKENAEEALRILTFIFSIIAGFFTSLR